MEYQKKDIFIEKSCRNVQQKLVPDLFIILVNNPKQPLYARNYFKSKIFRKEDYQKALKKITSFFLSNPVSFNSKIIKNKRGLELLTSRYSGYETSSENFLY